MLVRTGSRVLALALVALAVPLIAATPARAANVTCDLEAAGDPGPRHDVLRVNDVSESVTHIYRQGDQIVVSNNADRDAAVCTGGTPTVFNVDQIVYATESGVPFLNYSGDGPLAPGATDEPGDGDEIEISVTEGYEPKVLNVAGSGESERIEIGQRGERLVGVNLNAQDDGAAADVDVFAGLLRDEQIYLRVVAKGGDDEISALGAADYADPVSAAERLVMTGGAGDDILNGGPSRDSLSGDDGDDQLFGGRGNDTLFVGPGRDLAKGGKGGDRIDNRSDLGGSAEDLFPDRIFGGAGDDRINTERGLPGDRVDCGAGRGDELFGRRGDHAQRCEDVELR